VGRGVSVTDGNSVAVGGDGLAVGDNSSGRAVGHTMGEGTRGSSATYLGAGVGDAIICGAGGSNRRVLAGWSVGVRTMGTAVLANVGSADANSGAEREKRPVQAVSHTATDDSSQTRLWAG
jgi:hypothetical protein